MRTPASRTFTVCDKWFQWHGNNWIKLSTLNSLTLSLDKWYEKDWHRLVSSIEQIVKFEGLLSSEIEFGFDGSSRSIHAKWRRMSVGVLVRKFRISGESELSLCMETILRFVWRSLTSANKKEIPFCRSCGNTSHSNYLRNKRSRKKCWWGKKAFDSVTHGSTVSVVDVL